MTISRSAVLAAIEEAGQRMCGYTGISQGMRKSNPWLKTVCDCKYLNRETPTIPATGEQTGCCELRTLHGLISNMCDEQFKAWAGAAQPLKGIYTDFDLAGGDILRIWHNAGSVTGGRAGFSMQYAGQMGQHFNGRVVLPRREALKLAMLLLAGLAAYDGVSEEETYKKTIDDLRASLPTDPTS